jgi:hypothetical protein
MKRKCIASIGLAFLVAVIFFPVVALGQPIVIGWQVSGSGTQSGTIDTGLDWDVVYANPDTMFTWELSSPISIVLGTDNVATIDGLSIGVEADPFIDFGFSAHAGNSNTHFTFTSNLLLVNPVLTNAEGSASASVSFSSGTSSLTGNYGTKAYRAMYNGSQIFADLVNTPAYWPGASEFAPSTPISGSVTSMQTMWDVTVSARGGASGSSDFTILGDTIPEPATMALLGLGGLALIRKRRA